jgi:hypothetical protein
VAALTLLTFGLYIPIWLGITWSEMKRERHDPTMYPWWHALASFVPLYGWQRFYAHYEMMASLPWPRGTYTTVQSLPAVLGLIAGNILTQVGRQVPGPWPAKVVLTLASLVVTAVVLRHGQSCLNDYWLTAYPRRTKTRVHGSEWLLLVFGVCWFALAMVGMLVKR